MCKYPGCPNKVKNNHCKFCKKHIRERKLWDQCKQSVIKKGKEHGDLKERLERFFKKRGRSKDELIIPISKCEYFGCFEVGRENRRGNFCCTKHIELVKYWRFLKNQATMNLKMRKASMRNFHMKYGWYPGEKPRALLKAFNSMLKKENL